MWHWIEAHSASLQALAALLAVVVGVVTLAVLIATLDAARAAAVAAGEQAKAALAQMASANAATALARDQLYAAQDAAASEREHSDLIREQLLASLRPVLVFTRHSSNTFDTFLLENHGSGLALAVEAAFGMPASPGGVLTIRYTAIGAGSSAQIVSFPPPAAGAKFFVRYASTDGRQFITQVHVGEAFELVNEPKQVG